jgi:23S rRNA (guanine745-N1)-methyltransferase
MKLLICPLCFEPLLKSPQGICCSHSHQFDRAKEGYFNLLPVQFKGSREPGDAIHQLRARRAFLQSNYFLPLVNELMGLIPVSTSTLLDIGCGEGYFTREMSRHCVDADVYGIDIAKAAVRMAAKNSNNITYVVASSYSLPIADNSVDVITRIYAPSENAELRRVLKLGGMLILVTPGEEHLMGLRKKIYQEIRPHPQPLALDGFDEVSRKNISFTLELPPNESTEALLQMTPFAWRLPKDILMKLVAEGIQDTADFCVTVYQQTH